MTITPIDECLTTRDDRLFIEGLDIVEDLDEPGRIDRIAGRLGTRARIRFRVKPSIPTLWRATDFDQEKVSIDLGIQTYKFGRPAKYLPTRGREVLQQPNLDLMGIHFHAGRHHPSLWYWRGLMKCYARLVAELARKWGGWHPREIGIGGGFALYRDPHNKLGLAPRPRGYSHRRRLGI